MTRGQTGALNYAIPLNQQQVMQPPVSQQMRPQGDTFELPDDLAVVQDKTSKLFNNYGLLQNFIKSMRDQGIDPFTPDYAQDGGGLPYQTLLELDAGVRYAAQELKNEQEYRKQLDPYRFANKAGYAPGVNPQTDMLSQNPNSVVSYEELPFVQNANQRLNTATYTQGDQNRFNQAYYNPTLDQIDQLVQSGQLSPEEAAIQKANLQRNVAQTDYRQLIPRGGRGGANNSFEIDILKDTTNLAQGVWPEGTYSVTSKNGKAFLENRKRKGELLGSYEGADSKGNPKTYQKIIKRWLKDPQTGEVFIEYENADIPIEKVSDLRGDAIASSLISNNPKYGSVEKMYGAARELGLVDETGSVKNETLLPQNANDIKNAVRVKGINAYQTLDEKTRNLKNQLFSLSDPFFGNNWVDYTMPDGRVVQIAKHRGKNQYYLKNWEDSGYTSKDGLENLTLDEVFEVLDKDFKFFSKFLNESSQRPSPAPTPTPDLDPDI